jgi:lipopolysaccharide export system permease protein
MKTLDRYMLGTFFSSLFVFLATLLALYLAIDLFARTDEFFELENLKQPLMMFIAKYYAVRIPPFLVQLVPIAVLFAASFTLVRLAKSNEIVPIVSAGCSLYRVMLPFYGAAFFFALGIAASEEWLLPPLGEEIIETDGVIQKGDYGWSVLTRDSVGHRFFIFRFRHAEQVMNDVTVTRLDEHSRPMYRVFARSGVYERSGDAGSWRMTNGYIYTYRPEAEMPDFFEKEGLRATPDGRPIPIPPAGFSIPSDLQPEQVEAASADANLYLTLGETVDQAAKHPDRPRFRFRIHNRFAGPLSAFILLLVGPPFILSQRSHSVFFGLAVCILIAVLFFAAQFYALDLASKRVVHPGIAAWIPVFLFGSVGAWFTARIPT